MGLLLPVIQHVATQTYKTSYPTVHKYCTESRFINKNNISKNIKHRTCWAMHHVLIMQVEYGV